MAQGAKERLSPGRDARTEKLKETVEGLGCASTIPQTMKRVLEVVSSEKSSTSDLVKVIEQDQSLASKIISTANTAFYGFRGTVKSVPSAAVILGFNMIRNLAVSVSLFKGDKRSMKFLGALWQNSFQVAVATSLLAERTGLVRKEDAFFTGLVVDIGRALLYQIHGSEYIEVSLREREGLTGAEREHFGADHSQVGAWFLEKFGFDKDCVIAVKHHHSPEEHLESFRTGSLQLVAMVYLADILAGGGKTGPENDTLLSPAHDEIVEALYLDSPGLEEVAARVRSVTVP